MCVKREEWSGAKETKTKSEAKKGSTWDDKLSSDTQGHIGLSFLEKYNVMDFSLLLYWWKHSPHEWKVHYISS